MLYQQKPSVVSAELEGQVVLLHPDNGGVLVLNEAGSHVWHLVRQPLSLDRVVQGFTAVYQAIEREAEQDILTFLQSLMQKGLLDEN